MAKRPDAPWLVEEVAEFLASHPSQEEWSVYRPSRKAQDRFNFLLDKSKKGTISADEEWELNQFEHLEILIQAVKARIRTPRAVHS
jgi:hypothetical protein